MIQTSNIWKALVLTIYPDMFPGPLGQALIGAGLDNGIWSLKTLNIRSFAENKHSSIDDTPYGGGAGMIMRADVLDAAINNAKSIMGPEIPLIYLTPRGIPATQERIRKLSKGPGVSILCGRFEGIDQRVIEAHKIEEICLGDFILSGGEIASMAILEGCIRLLPGILGSTESIKDESFELGLLEYPHYTRPKCWNKWNVPEVLLSGHHKNITAWRYSKSLEITEKRRPDMWQAFLSRRKH